MEPDPAGPPADGLDPGMSQRLTRPASRRKRTGRPLAAGIAVCVVILFLAAVMVNQQSQRSAVPPILYLCFGEVAVRLHNGNVFWPVSYRLVVETGENVSERPSGSLAAGDDVDFRFPALCGPHRVWVSWNDGPWTNEEIVVERGKTYPTYFSY